MRISRLALGGMAAVLLGAASACMGPSGSPTLTARPGSLAPLQAQLFPPYYGEVPVSLNRPAYIALFEILPGRGVSLLYPSAGSGLTQVRETWVPMRYSAQRWLYASRGYDDPASGQWSGFDYGYGAGYGMSSRSLRGAGAPRYLFLIASENPINVNRFQHDLASLRNYLGQGFYASYRPYDVMEQLAYAVVPPAGDDSWVTDVFVDWGYDWGYGYTPGTSAAMASWQPILCADGSVGMARWVSGWGFDSYSCVPRQSTQAPPRPVVPGEPGDSSATRDRTETTDKAGRGRAQPAPGARAEGSAEQSEAEVRSRIAQLRDEAMRTRFANDLNDQVRQGLELRHRADRLMWQTPAGGGGGGNTSASRPSTGSRSGMRSRDASRSGGASAGRASGSSGSVSSQPASAPRSREASSTRPQTRSEPSARPSTPTPPRSRPSTPPPSESSSRSRPDAS